LTTILLSLLFAEKPATMQADKFKPLRLMHGMTLITDWRQWDKRRPCCNLLWKIKCNLRIFWTTLSFKYANEEMKSDACLFTKNI